MIYHLLYLSLDTIQETCSNRVQDMTCLATKHFKFDSCLDKLSHRWQVVDMFLDSVFHSFRFSEIILNV